MTYYEILVWIQGYVTEINEINEGVFEITYIGDFSNYTIKSDSLIQAVLDINEVDLIG